MKNDEIYGYRIGWDGSEEGGPKETQDEVEVVGGDNASREYEGTTARSTGAGDAGWVSWLACHVNYFGSPRSSTE